MKGQGRGVNERARKIDQVILQDPRTGHNGAVAPQGFPKGVDPGENPRFQPGVRNQTAPILAETPPAWASSTITAALYSSPRETIFSSGAKSPSMEYRLSTAM